MASNISKIERVSASRAPNVWVDLKLNKDTGVFFADVGRERVQADTKVEAIKKTQAALDRVTQADWREVIVIRVDKRRNKGLDEEDERAGIENGMPVYGASCQLTYFRRERAQNPLKPKETIERSHREDFERAVAERREREAYFEHTAEAKRKRADEAERELRQGRAALAGTSPLWNYRDNTVEYEIPYSEEAWAGIRRIAQTLFEVQAKLDEFSRSATPAKLAALSPGDVFKQLPPAKRDA